MSNTHEWCARGIKSYIKKLKDLNVGNFPWIEKIIKKHETVYVPRVKDLPPEAKSEKREFDSE
ncbi:MAG: Fis family transcriptional regulator, partial [bacterium]|nr:Fis family transcriptional regulator [bacterium]